MSSTKRGAHRSPHDFYETPAESAAPAMRELAEMWLRTGLGRVPTILDAGAGMGSLTREAREAFGAAADIIAVEAYPHDLPLVRALSMFEEGAYRATLAQGLDEYAARLVAAGAGAVEIGDFLDYSGDVDIVVANPPFSAAMDFLQHAVEDLRQEVRRTSIVAFLLRLNFLGSAERAPWLEQHPPRAIRVLTKRPDFTGAGGDSIEYAWMFWGAGVPAHTPPIGWYR